jgi:hypothetical protein
VLAIRTREASCREPDRVELEVLRKLGHDVRNRPVYAGRVPGGCVAAGLGDNGALVVDDPSGDLRTANIHTDGMHSLALPH